jgi:DNA-directed RNA polymerase sigma subunit (sigma70/sigma32)
MDITREETIKEILSIYNDDRNPLSDIDLLKLANHLDERERFVMSVRYSMGLTLEQISKLMPRRCIRIVNGFNCRHKPHCSTKRIGGNRVRIIECYALQKLRRFSNKWIVFNNERLNDLIAN